MYVEQIMSTQVDTATEEMKISQVSRLMKEKGRRYLPVVDGEQRLIGMFGRKQLLQAEPSAITTLSVGEVNYLTSKVTVGQLMQRNPLCCTPGTLIESAGQMMGERKVACLPVVRDGRVIGIVSETDILDFFLDITGSTLTDTTRIAVRIPHRVRELANFLNKISDGGGRIASVVSPMRDSDDKERIVIVRYWEGDHVAIDKSLQELGYKLITEDIS